MFLKSLFLSQFRNYQSQEITFHNKSLIIVGDNAQGKTNLLESICLLSTVRSPRDKKLSNLIAFNSNKAKITAKVSSTLGDLNIELTIARNGKQILVNKNKLTKMTELLGLFSAVYLGPFDIELIRGEPAFRRQFIDIVNAQANKMYAEAVQKYQRLLKIRNSLLRQEIIDETYLLTINEQLSDYGIRITNWRLNSFKEIEPFFQKRYAKVSKEKVKIDYTPSAPLIKEQYQKQLQDKLEKDKFLGSTSIGPHRDDFKVTINGNEAKDFASNGQQRAISVTMKLSQIDYLNKITGHKPILLLDDVLLELDDDTLEKVLEMISDLDQVIITTTSLSRLPEAIINKSEIIEVKQGKLKQKE